MRPKDESPLVIIRIALAVAVLLLLGIVLGRPLETLAAASNSEIPLSGFADGIKHWQLFHGNDYPRYAPYQVVEIADNLLLYQGPGGGWGSNRDPTRILNIVERAKVKLEKLLPGGSFDNHNVYPQVEYLAAAYELTGKPRYREASLLGLQFILAHQNPDCGGWPHTVPAIEAYQAYLTIADEVTPGVLAMLRRAAAGQPPFGYLEVALRQRLSDAIERGEACLLRLQLRQNGILTGWAGQYHPKTLTPAQGRRFELPSIAARETVEVLRYLMSLEAPSPQVIAAVDGAVAWLKSVQLRGLRLVSFPANPIRNWSHTIAIDYLLDADPAGAPLWARFYDLADNSVVLATPGGQRVPDFGQVPRESRVSYEWFGDWPRLLLESEYPAWRKKLGR